MADPIWSDEQTGTTPLLKKRSFSPPNTSGTKNEIPLTWETCKVIYNVTIGNSRWVKVGGGGGREREICHLNKTKLLFWEDLPNNSQHQKLWRGNWICVKNHEEFK